MISEEGVARKYYTEEDIIDRAYLKFLFNNITAGN